LEFRKALKDGFDDEDDEENAERVEFSEASAGIFKSRVLGC
jgi:hypothetical protein